MQKTRLRAFTFISLICWISKVLLTAHIPSLLSWLKTLIAVLKLEIHRKKPSVALLSSVKSVTWRSRVGCPNHQSGGGTPARAISAAAQQFYFFFSPLQSVICVNPQMHPVWLCILSTHSDLRKHPEDANNRRCIQCHGQGSIWPPRVHQVAAFFSSTQPVIFVTLSDSSGVFLRGHSSLSLPRPVSSALAS